MSGMWLVVYGLETGSLRKKYMAKAIKDGEKDAEERFGLPNLYVTGGGEHAKAFNCYEIMYFPKTNLDDTNQENVKIERLPYIYERFHGSC
jgi:hypothetical protein